jgi:5-methylcytosine-specific restriction endonuclease McrA
MCQPCYSKARYNANREHMLEVGRRWRERNPDYFKQPKLTARAAANFRERYYGGLYEAALERDASTCQHCGLVSKPGRGRNGLHVHHVDGDNTNNVLENLQVLCCPCHAREHRRRGDFAPAA